MTMATMASDLERHGYIDVPDRFALEQIVALRCVWSPDPADGASQGVGSSRVVDHVCKRIERLLRSWVGSTQHQRFRWV